MLSSSQPMLNLTTPEDPKPSLRDNDSSGESEMEELQPPLMSTKLIPHDTVAITSYTNPLLSDSSDEDCEMVEPSKVIVRQPLTKITSQDTKHYMANHPSLKRMLYHEQNPLPSESSSDEDCEMVQPGRVVVYQPPVKKANRDAKLYRASHPPLKRTLNHEQLTAGVAQQARKRRHKPKLKSILEEDGDPAHHTYTM